jgi:bifunctional non-homologous end joining protein LigD
MARLLDGGDWLRRANTRLTRLTVEHHHTGEVQPLPTLIRPMLATLGELPPGSRDAQYGYELKWDGIRAVAYIASGTFRLLSRNDKDVTHTYPELADFGAAAGDRQLVLDGEIVAFNDAGRPSFGALQYRMHVGDPAQARRLAAKSPVTYLLFDILHIDGTTITGGTYTERRGILDALGLRGPGWDTPPYFAGGGSAAQSLSLTQGMEGIVAKRLDSIYEPDRRSRNWIKVKNLRTQEVIIGGWKPGQGRRGGGIGSLLLGVPGDEGLVYVGHVGTGFTDRMLADLGDRLRGLAQQTSPFDTLVPARDAKDAHWVKPRLVGEVAFGEWTPDARMRHPSWRGLRPDKSPAEVRRES